jgi:hypothetical protein
VLCAHHGRARRLPFSTREVLATISSPLRVCLTPWSVFQDGWRHPISYRQHGASRKRTRLARGCRDSMSARFTNTPVVHFGYGSNRTRSAAAENAVGLVLATEMEVLPLSLSRFQVLCHSLSKVLFKLSLTLLVRYRSSYSVFNFGRHIPAD